MSHYENTWGPESPHQSGGMSVAHPNCDRSIMDGIKDLSYLDNDWLRELAATYSQCDCACTTYATNANHEQAMIAWVKTLYNQISIYVDQFNRSVSENHLRIDRCEPEFHRIPSPDHAWFAAERAPLIFDCHFSTHGCALILKGNGEHIKAYVVPSSAWLGLCASNDDVFPAVAICSISGLDGMFTTLRLENRSTVDVFIESYSIPFIAKFLFEQLILFSNKSPETAH